MASATDVPSRFDVVINGTGYLFDDAQESVYVRVRATYTYSPTFVERQNVQGDFGDNQQEFWLTASQSDWSGGEDQRFFRQSDAASRTQYWSGTNIDQRIEGQASMRPQAKNLTLTSAAQGVIAAHGNTGKLFQTGTTNLYEIASDGTITDDGAHGLGATPLQWAMATDGTNLFISSTNGGSVGVRRWSGSAFSTFSATPAFALTYLNNTLFGLGASANLLRYDTAGTATTLYSWLTATGAAPSMASPQVKLLGLGGKVVILRSLTGTPESRTELSIYDGVGVSTLHVFEPNFAFADIVESQGILFISGTFQGPSNSSRATVLYYANGEIGTLWTSHRAGTSGCGLAAYDGGIVWIDTDTNQYVYWDVGRGAMHRIAGLNVSTVAYIAGGTFNFLGYRTGSTTSDLFPDGTTRPTSSTMKSSLFDFDSSLDKLFRGIKVDFDSATDGDGGSVDIAYRVGDQDGVYTTLQTGVTSGTEYTLTGVSGRNLSVKLTLNKGTSTKGPVIKRVYVRAAPVLQQFPLRQYVLSCYGSSSVPQILRDGTPNPKTGREMADALVTSIASTTPITVTDRFGSFTGIIEPGQSQIDEVHPEPLQPPSKSGSFRATVLVRGV